MMCTKLKPNQFLLDGHLITEHGILFSTEMVKANLEGRKTMTRRTKGLDYINENPNRWDLLELKKNWGNSNTVALFEIKDSEKSQLPQRTNVYCPYGKPGDLLYVRENFKLGAWREDGRMAFDYMASPELTNTHWCMLSVEEDPDGEKFNAICEKATNQLISKGIKSDENGYYHWEVGKSPLKWKPSIHLPKSGSRIWVMIEDIRVERLHEINEEDAIAEGVEYLSAEDNGFWCGWKNYDIERGGNNGLYKPELSFNTLWTSINGIASWNQNPWVWVIKYRILSKTGRPSMEVIKQAYGSILSPPSGGDGGGRKEASNV